MSGNLEQVKRQQEWSPQPEPNQAFKITKMLNPNVEQYSPNGQWTEEENMKYANFIRQNVKFMEGKDSGKLWNMFKKMAKVVKTRNFLQCKSHHQKLLKKLQTIPDILAYFALHSQSSQAERFQNPYPINLLHNVQQKQQDHKIEEVNEPIFKPLIIHSHSLLPMPSKQKQPDPTKEAYEEEENKWHKQKNMQLMGNASLFPSETSISVAPLPHTLDRRKEWLECHAIFLMWASKLSKLTSSYAH